MPLKPIWFITWDILMVITIKIRNISGKENCTFVFESRYSKSGNFSSPGWPSRYPNNMRCIYYFLGEPFEAINITFLVFDLEAQFPKGCLTDYIDISTITAFNVKRLVGRYCGVTVPSPLLSMHPRSEIIFKTNHVITGPGFFGSYEFLNESLIGPPASTISKVKDCGGEEKGFGGIIKSPNYPNSFPKQMDCMWLIRVNQNQHIYLRIMQLQLFGSIANCKDAHLAIYDGYENYDYEHHEPKKYCGDLKYYKSLDDKVQLSANNRLLIRFKSDIAAPQWEEQVASQEITGFKLIWTAVTFKPKDECKEFLCGKSEFCLTPNSGSICKRKEYFCIDRSLMCNGIPNCSEQDSSDEDQCSMSNRLHIGTGLCALTIIFAIIFCWCCRHQRHHCTSSRRSSSSGLRTSRSSAFTLKSSDNSISIKHLNHSPSYVDQPEILLPLDQYYSVRESSSAAADPSSSARHHLTTTTATLSSRSLKPEIVTSPVFGSSPLLPNSGKVKCSLHGTADSSSFQVPDKFYSHLQMTDEISSLDTTDNIPPSHR